MLQIARGAESRSSCLQACLFFPASSRLCIFLFAVSLSMRPSLVFHRPILFIPPTSPLRSTPRIYFSCADRLYDLGLLPSAVEACSHSCEWKQYCSRNLTFSLGRFYSFRCDRPCTNVFALLSCSHSHSMWLFLSHWYTLGFHPKFPSPPSFLYPFKSQKHGENLFINTKNIFVCTLSVLILSSLFPPRACPTLLTDTHARYQRVCPEYWYLFLPPADILRCHPTPSSTLDCVRLYLVW